MSGQVVESFSYWEIFNIEIKINGVSRLLILHVGI